MNGQQQPPEPQGGPEGTSADLAEVQKHAVELLGQLDRPPRNLRIRAGDVAVDITWFEGAGPPDPPAPARVAATAVPAAPAAEVPASSANGTGEYLRSPGVGVFYHAREPGAEPFVAVGSKVQPGQQIGIIEAMKLMIPIEADRAGRITGVLKANGASVEYDEPLFALETVDA